MDHSHSVPQQWVAYPVFSVILTFNQASDVTICCKSCEWIRDSECFNCYVLIQHVVPSHFSLVRTSRHQSSWMDDLQSDYIEFPTIPFVLCTWRSILLMFAPNACAYGIVDRLRHYVLAVPVSLEVAMDCYSFNAHITS